METAGWSVETAGELRCGLCRGELYPGDPYFELDGRIVCEDCLGRYAQGYFAHQRRKAGGRGTGDGNGALRHGAETGAPRQSRGM